MEEPIPCPTCGPVVPTERTTCPTCGASLFTEKLEHISAKMREIHAGFAAAQQPRMRLGTVNGIGTTLLRYRAWDDTGNYVATRWFTIGGVPILPLSRHVVRPLERVQGISRQTYRFDIVSKEPMDWAEVAVTWGIALAGAAPPLYLFTHMREMNRWVGDGPAMLMGLASLILFGFLMVRLHNADRVFKQRADPGP
jgi:hypothetical protein